VVLRFPGSRAAKAVADGPSLGRVNYFIGNDPGRWANNVDQYARVRYKNLYDGIDLALYENSGRLEHDFIIVPGADPGAIKLAFTGSTRLRLGGDGALLVGTKQGELRFAPPHCTRRSIVDAPLWKAAIVWTARPAPCISLSAHTTAHCVPATSGLASLLPTRERRSFPCAGR
jgi:hypothetical protein